MNLGDRERRCLFPELPVSNIVTNDDRYYGVALMPVGLHFDDYLLQEIYSSFFFFFFLHGKRGMNYVTEILMQSKFFTFIPNTFIRAVTYG
jgi:hypothetical protein